MAPGCPRALREPPARRAPTAPSAAPLLRCCSTGGAGGAGRGPARRNGGEVGRARTPPRAAGTAGTAGWPRGEPGPAGCITQNGRITLFRVGGGDAGRLGAGCCWDIFF